MQPNTDYFRTRLTSAFLFAYSPLEATRLDWERSLRAEAATYVRFSDLRRDMRSRQQNQSRDVKDIFVVFYFAGLITDCKFLVLDSDDAKLLRVLVQLGGSRVYPTAERDAV